LLFNKYYLVSWVFYLAVLSQIEWKAWLTKQSNMSALTITIKDIDALNNIQKKFLEYQPITTREQSILGKFLSQIPPTSTFLSKKISFDENITVSLWTVSLVQSNLKRWQSLFANLPGWDYCPFCYIVDDETPELLQKNVIIVAWFAPSYAYNSIRSEKNRAYEVWLKDDGTALFQVPTLKDAKLYPKLYNFKGSWKEAYLLLIETLRKGWPMEEFPEELKPFLKK